MRVINVRNVHEALPEGVAILAQEGLDQETRNGDTIVHPGTVTTHYECPRERVVLWEERDANPFFHFYEGLWMLGGCEDVGRLTRFVRRMATFSDDGKIFHGAYGYRWRRFFQLDQVRLIGEALKTDPTCRRQVLEIWHGPADLVEQKDKRDIPCNLVATFQVDHLGALNMVVFCRSNDMVWGCYGANAVHFSMLQEVVAAIAEVPVGWYEHVSANWHAYTKTLEPLKNLKNARYMPTRAGATRPNPYNNMRPFTMVNTNPDTWFSDLEMFLDCEGAVTGYRDVFFRHVALPIVAVHNAYRQLPQPSNYEQAMTLCDKIKADDWAEACHQWLLRRYRKWTMRALAE